MFKYSKLWMKLLLLLPSLIFFCVYVLYPVGYSLFLSFQFKPTYQPGHFIGLANFVTMAKDVRLWTALKNTSIIIVLQLALIPALSFLLGLFINQRFLGSTVVKVLVFTPYILSGIVTTLVWFFVVDPRIGLINSFLNFLHIDTTGLLLIGGRTLTPYTVAVIETWKSLGFYSVIIMAGLKMIPAELYDAAMMDGASAVQKVRYITLPMLRETNKIVAVYVFINAVQSLQTVYILTKGGPNFQSHTVGSYLYEVFLSERRAGYASSIAFLMFVLILGVSIIFLQLNARRIDE